MVCQRSAFSLHPKDVKRRLGRTAQGKGGPSVSLGKRQTVTPALLAANRAKAQKCNGPGTLGGDRQSGLQFEAIMLWKISHLKIREVLKAIMLLKIS